MDLILRHANLPDGTTGIGKFGLMDYGSNNGRGVIPAAPTPWTRIKIADKYSDSDSLVTTISHPGIYTLSPRDSVDMIYKINISDSVASVSPVKGWINSIFSILSPKNSMRNPNCSYAG